MFNKPTVFIDPSYSDYYQDRLFDSTNQQLNRDDGLSPFHRLHAALKDKKICLHTADFLLKGEVVSPVNNYYSLGLLNNYMRLVGDSRVKLCGFLIMEPPVVAPHLYKALPTLTRHFERVYVHNIDGDGYSLKDVDKSKLRKFYWPQPFKDVLYAYWEKKSRLNRIVVINGNHIPRSLKGQLYSKRIHAMVNLAKLGIVDLYGRGWNKWWSHRSMWPPYWFNYKTLMSIYKGACVSKYEVLSNYRFSLCFENMEMSGYVTEKIFDCFYTGTIPIYLGAKDITSLIPAGAFIDMRKFNSWDEILDFTMAMSESDVSNMRQIGRDFIKSPAALKYYNSLLSIFDECNLE
jgi:hypothetical protein